MAGQDRNFAEAAFRSAAMNAWETGSKLRDRVMVQTGVEAETDRHYVIGTTEGNQRGSGQDVSDANVQNAKPTAMLTPDENFNYLDRQDRALYKVEVMRGYGKASGNAVARRLDAKVIPELAKSFADWTTNAGGLGPYIHPGMTEKNSVDASNGGLNSANMAEAKEMLMEWDFDVDMEELTLLYPASEFSKMAAEMRFASMDYMQGTGAPGVNKTGRFEEIYGMKPIFIGQKARKRGATGEYIHNGALPDNRAYVFAKSSVGLSIGVTERMGVVEWVPQKRSWMIGAECNSGAVVTQAAGIVEITLV